ncbi:phage tail protein [Colwellia sp. RSH04]|uniref:phage tail protein n=1 Tax=Colwellia sp. RSH04 TaxID=2305464 RepID=UPI000E58DEAE|nr:tail fiber protein [Colwellia sp. RSH04]RHW77998.1 phage tail protein [Colwellia sp. RSH04]
MSDPFVGEIRMFAGTFAPRQWAYCDGQELAISQNESLFSLIGTVYGGDGRVSFALPDMRGRLPVHQGTGPGLTNQKIGNRYGTQKVTLNHSEVPSHKHTFNVSTDKASASVPTNNVLAAQNDGDMPYITSSSVTTTIQSLTNETIAATGESQGHSNMMPSLCVNFIIALFGTYPSRH